MQNNTLSIPTQTPSRTYSVDFEKLVALMPGQVYWKDRDCIIMGCNDRQLQALGLKSKEALIGRTGYDLIWQGLSDTERAHLAERHTEIDRNIMASGTAQLFEEILTTAEGQKPYLIQKIPLKNAEDDIIGLLSIAIEFSKSKKNARHKTPPKIEDLPIQQQLPLNDPVHPPLKILLVGDNQIVSKTTKTLLESFEHIVETASSSAEALMRFEPKKYDMIFTDVGLPGLDGYTLSEQLRSAEEALGATPIPIIALTTYDSDTISKKASASGINAILTKPLSARQVLKVTKQFVYAPQNSNNALLGASHPIKPLGHPSMSKSIDLEEGARILGSDQTTAKEMLVDLIDSLPETRAEIEEAYCANNTQALSSAVHKFYGGLCYVGVPPLRQAAKELEAALLKQEQHQLNRLYQRILDEMSAVEREFETLRD